MGNLANSNTSAGTIAGKAYWDDDVEESFSTEGGTADRTMTCAWDDRIAIIQALSGGTTQVGIIGQNTPASTYPDLSSMEVKAVRTEGVGLRKVGVNGMVGYEFCRLHIHYATTAKDIGNTQDLGALSLDIAGEIYSPPRDEATFKWVSDDEDVTPEATPGLSVSVTTFSRVRRNLGAIPIPLILSLIDHVNDNLFEGASAGKIIFVGCRPYRKVTNLGAQNWDCEYIFKHRRIEWNKFLRPSTGQFEEIVYKATGEPFYPEGNLSALYQ